MGVQYNFNSVEAVLIRYEAFIWKSALLRSFTIYQWPLFKRTFGFQLEIEQHMKGTNKIEEFKK